MSSQAPVPEKAAQPPGHTNRLIRETSPYLLQHAHNPVDWYPWGPEAFDAARRENRPIFLSVGYSTCYWCHVMERQSFEVPAIAAEMNRRFINIKVDREERPDVDQLYMTAVQVLTRQGGWPMSVFLAPDLRPFYGGTYFPPTDQYGRPGFLTVLAGIDDAWQNRKTGVDKSADQLVQILQRLAEPQPLQEAVTIDADFIDDLIARSASDYEPNFGGFGQAPKFPRETLLELLLVYLASDDAPDNQSKISKPKSQIRPMLFHALDAMAHGGIRDQLGGGFHRYSTDAKWLVPHFEIMLYDNAMLGWCYAEAFRQSADPRYAAIARGIFDFILRETTSPAGAFYTALDAEVDAQEGLSYLWTKHEIQQVLGVEDAAIFNRVYGVDRGPNFADPHHGSGTPDKSILYLAHPQLKSAGPPALLDENLAQMRQKLYEVRQKRKQPLLDTKIITSWNALMIRALAYGGKILKDRRYIDAASRAADFLLSHHRHPDGSLLRTSGGGATRAGGPVTEPGAAPPSIPGFLDDYAYLVQAFLALEEAGAGERWKTEAQQLSKVMLERFGDLVTVGSAHPTPDVRGFFFTEKDAKDLIIRQKVATDSPLPSGNAVAAMAMLALGQPQAARGTLGVFAQPLQQQGEGMSAMIQAALLYLRKHGAFTIMPEADAAAADRPTSPQQTAAEVVQITAEWSNPKQLLVHLTIAPGFHLNAHEVESADLPLIPTTLAVNEPAGVVDSIDYPLAEEQSVAFMEAPIRVYSGEVTIAVQFRTPIIGQGVKLSLSYQACDESACLPPVTKGVRVGVD